MALLLTPIGFPSSCSMRAPRTSSIHLLNCSLSTRPVASSSIILNASLVTLSICIDTTSQGCRSIRIRWKTYEIIYLHRVRNTAARKTAFYIQIRNPNSKKDRVCYTLSYALFYVKFVLDRQALNQWTYEPELERNISGSF